MRKKTLQNNTLRFWLVLSLIILSFSLKKRNKKEWLLIYLLNAVSNGFIDMIIVKNHIVKFPIRLLPKIFNINILFDFFVYPTITVVYNQMSYYDKPLTSLYKLLFVSIPMLLIEYWLEAKTDLIEWRRGWKWYHTYTSIVIKSLLERLLVGKIREVRSNDTLRSEHAYQGVTKDY
ncbi:CBO0543 family protein [Salipaludibacillus sp. HK11]|uniref:CBO0543 family protein n=1 Tax=Salipaludibacillus sp. HK11 TaxID=3394320 RepID=UPI0039FD2876